MQRVSLVNADVAFDADSAIPGARNQCWVTSLCILLGPMAREEIRRELKGIESIAAIGLSHLVEAGLRLARADRVVFPGHRVLTTSLYEEDEVERLCALKYPGRAVVLRSLNTHYHADILAQGGTLWPVRLVWIIDDVARDWRPRRDARRDLHALENLGLARGRYRGTMPATVLDQVLILYRRLYIDRYSRHNPDYTADYVRAMLADGTLQILTLERGGKIEAFCALHRRGRVLSVPMVGYDLDIKDLYRAVMALPALEAERLGLALNLSAGAGRFKRHRGASAHVEYLLILDDHLPVWRRLAYRATARLLKTLEPQLIRAATR